MKIARPAVHPLAAVGSPASLVLLGPSLGTVPDLSGREDAYDGVNRNTQQYMLARMRHSGGANYTFADGHAKWFKAPDNGKVQGFSGVCCSGSGALAAVSSRVRADNLCGDEAIHAIPSPEVAQRRLHQEAARGIAAWGNSTRAAALPPLLPGLPADSGDAVSRMAGRLACAGRRP